MIRILLFISMLFLSLVSLGQEKDLGGSWTGVLYQEDGGFRSEYPMHLEVTQRGKNLDGYCFIGFYDRDDITGEMVFKSKIVGDSLQFKEPSLLEENVEKGMVWCLKYGTISISETDDLYVMEGNWEGTPSNHPDRACHGGRIRFEKPKDPVTANDLELNPILETADETNAAEREVLVGTRVETHYRELEIEVYDATSLDGDVISLQYRGEWLCQNLTLSRTPAKFTIQVDPDEENVLLLYAVNLGKIPPNSAAIRFYDGRRMRKVTLESDLESCDVIRLVYVK